MALLFLPWGGTNIPKVAQYYNCLKKILPSYALRKLRKVSFVAVKRRNKGGLLVSYKPVWYIIPDKHFNFLTFHISRLLGCWGFFFGTVFRSIFLR